MRKAQTLALFFPNDEHACELFQRVSGNNRAYASNQEEVHQLKGQIGRQKRLSLCNDVQSNLLKINIMKGQIKGRIEMGFVECPNKCLVRCPERVI